MECDTDPDLIAAALLHDVVEDTHLSYSDIVSAGFGIGIADLVAKVTNVSAAEHNDREDRKRMDRERLALASDRAQTIKLADIIHNSSDVHRQAPKFAKVFLAEKGCSSKCWIVATRPY